MSLRNLFEEVREEGKIEIKNEPFIKDSLPIIYEGEINEPTNNGVIVNYHNSGGRSIIIERGETVYRIKGVDPYRLLTEKIANSSKNKINNVCQWNFSRKTGHSSEKPFGVLTWENIQNKAEIYGKLNQFYNLFGIIPPLEYLTHQKVDEVRGINREDVYQVVFKLNKPETDLRVSEFDALLTERLDQCSPTEIKSKVKNINRLYGRLISWAGFNTAILALNGLLPTNPSFVPQNWVISPVEGGYGIFRVDHSSTKINKDSKEVIEELLKERNGLPNCINEFSIMSERVQVAADPKLFLPKEKRNMKFSQILLNTNDIAVDYSKIIEAHKNVFFMGMGLIPMFKCPPAITEEMFREALE